MMIQWDQQSGGMGEDCLVLNVWTPGVNDGAKRAVLVSFHGGGFTSGSGNAPGFDGAQLALFGDVVVVTVNHRLASYGYTHLADLGAPPEFVYAGVTGILDLVASLQWVHDNIGNFGGDPGRVMIFGQSGGGAKTSTVLATRSAKGLFHRAAVQSGFSRVVDGTVLPHHPFDPVAPPESADVPVIISTTLEDSALALTNFNLDEAGLKTVLAQRYADKADAILALYKQRYPQKSPYLIQAQIFTDAGFRRSAITQAEREAALGKAPASMYLWSWVSPGHGGKFGAVHGTDVSASFHNVRDNIVGVGSPDGKVMCDRLASAWVAFAKTGDPNNPQIPRWPAYDASARATMVFDTDTRVENDPRGEIRKFWGAMPPARGIAG